MRVCIVLLHNQKETAYVRMLLFSHQLKFHVANTDYQQEFSWPAISVLNKETLYNELISEIVTVTFCDQCSAQTQLATDLLFLSVRQMCYSLPVSKT